MKTSGPISLLLVTFILISGCKKDDEDDQIPQDYVAKYDLNGNANDDSKYGNNGVIVGDVVPTTDRFGQENAAMFFVSDSCYIDIGDVDVLKLTGSLSISVWVKAEVNPGDWNTIVNKWLRTGPGVGTGYYLGINPEGFKLRWNVSNNILDMDAALPADNWAHIVVTFHGAKLSMYLNNSFIGEAPYDGSLTDNTAPFRIGSQSGEDVPAGVSNFHGAIDDVIVYRRVLNASEIRLLFEERY